MSGNSGLEIRRDDLSGAEIRGLLAEHLRIMAEVTPRESIHAMDVDELRGPGITFWTVWRGGELAGCGAMKELDGEHGEVKSMRTVRTHLRGGIASMLLDHIIAEARRRGYRRLSLETGAMPYFEPARALYRKFGFRACGPFGAYGNDPNTVFMTLEIQGRGAERLPG